MERDIKHIQLKVPEELRNRIKGGAARRGMTLPEYAELLQNTLEASERTITGGDSK